MNILLFLIILVVLIVVHEFGHFIVAKRSGIRVDEFGIGFPPRALTFWKKGETIYTLNWLPIGGFVKIFGEDPNEESLEGPDRKRALVHKPRWVQALVLSAGVGFNILLAWVLFSVAFMVGTPTMLSDVERGTVSDATLQIVNVLPDSPAALAGLLGGDTVISISSSLKEVESLTPEAVTSFITDHRDEEITISIDRAGEKIAVDLHAIEGLIDDELTRPAIGIGMGIVGTLRLPPHLALYESAKFTGQTLVAIVVALLGFFASAFTLTADLSQVAGPVGIVGLVGDAASLGLVSLLMFTAFISLNLAIINLLPVPALDGGRLLFVAIEAVKRSPINPKVANTLNTLGFVFLILLMIAVTYNDIVRIVG